MRLLNYIAIGFALFISTSAIAQNDAKTLTVFYYDLVIDDVFRADEKGAEESFEDFKE